MITTVQCSSICSQLNNKPRVCIVVTDFRLHHTCSGIIILWLHSLSGIRSLLCNPCAFSTGIIKWVELARNRNIRIFSVFARTCARGISHKRHGYTDVVFAPTTYNKWLGRTRHPYIRAVYARYHVRANTEKMRDCHPVARTCDNEVGVAISIRDPYTSPFTSRCK